MELQENDFACTPCCIKMILDFVRLTFKGFVPNMSVEEISRAIGTDELGTPLENVEKINEKLLKTLPSVEFKAEINCSFSELENEILNGRPVVAWVKTPHSHSIVVTGIDKGALIVYCNDPEVGRRTWEMGPFVSAWNENFNILIKVKIGEKVQRIIPEYAEKSERSQET